MSVRNVLTPQGFEWDDAKNRINVEKHGVSFEFALRIFEGPVWTMAVDRPDLAERRDVSIGSVDGIALLAVIHTDREGRTRLISARAASRRERTLYEQELRPAVDGRRDRLPSR